MELEGQTITVKGKNGSLNYTYPQLIKVALEGNEILVSRPDDEKYHGSYTVQFALLSKHGCWLSPRL